MSSCKGENGEMNSLYKDTFPIQRIRIWNPSFYCSLWLGWRKFEDFEISQQPQKDFSLKKKKHFSIAIQDPVSPTQPNSTKGRKKNQSLTSCI